MTGLRWVRFHSATLSRKHCAIDALRRVSFSEIESSKLEVAQLEGLEGLAGIVFDQLQLTAFLLEMIE